MSLLNFKGVRELTVDFDEHETNIFGANHMGRPPYSMPLSGSFLTRTARIARTSASEPTTRTTTSSRSCRMRFLPASR